MCKLKFVTILVFLMLGVANTWAAKKITIKVVPETASIYVDGQKVGTGSYQLKFKDTDFYIIKIEADGYETEKFQLRKDYPYNSIAYQLHEDEALAASVGAEDGVDLANKWFDVKCKKGLSEDKVWKRLMSVCTSYFDNIEVRDKSAGWIKTSWKLTTFSKKVIRTRVEVRMNFTDDDELSYRVRICVQEKKKDCKGEQCFKDYDRVLRTYEPFIQELQTSVGGGE